MGRVKRLRTATIDRMGKGMAAYGRLLRRPSVRSVLLLAFLWRVPAFASFIVITLHVVDGLDRSYAAAGVLTTVSTVALAVSGPWRGRSLDRVGVRATLGPQLLVLIAVWSVAPFTPYLVLLVLVFVGGLANLPTFSITRQALIAAVDDEDRTAALSLDALFTELSFMIGPVLGVLAVAWWGTTWSLLGSELLVVLGGFGLWLANPPLVRADTAHAVEVPLVEGMQVEPADTVAAEHVRLWREPAVMATLAAGVAATIVLNGTELGTVGALRAMGEAGSIGPVLAVWGFGSAVGALVYGALHRPIPVFVLLAFLAATTVPVALAHGQVSLALLLLVCGLFCAPTITAISDGLSRVVPENRLGEALGWQGVAFTAGSALGAPLAGTAIDRTGWEGAFVVTGMIALAAAVAALLLQSGKARALGQQRPSLNV